MTARVKLNVLERRSLAIIYPTGSVAVGKSVYADLEHRGFVERFTLGNRYQLTSSGARAIEGWPESQWKMPQPKQRAGWRR